MKTVPVMVAGAGPAGLVSALCLADAGFEVALVAPRAAVPDRRTTALMAPALALLDGAGIGPALRETGTPLKTMRIIDGTDRLIRAPTVTFHASEVGEEAFGLNVANADLLGVLAEAVSARAAITRIEASVERWDCREDAVVAHLSDGSAIQALLAVGADGRNSPARQAAGIETRLRPTGQTALVLNFSHARDHHFTSNEFHTSGGPFTQVPLSGRRSSLVWVARDRQAESLAALPDEALAQLIEERLHSILGRVTVEPGRQAYPLASALPRSFAGRRIALVGEAAHLFPPIGAQGLNLGIRDIAELTAVARVHASDPGAPAALAAYDRRRRPDIVLRSSAVNLLNRSLLSDMLPAQLARAAGLDALRAFAPLRAFFMREGLRTGGGISALLPGSVKQA